MLPVPLTRSHVPGKRVKLYFGVCLWRCFRKILAFESLYWGKQSALPNVASLVAGWENKKSACQRRRCGFEPWIGKIPWRRKWQPTPVFLSGSRILVSDSFAIPWTVARKATLSIPLGNGYPLQDSCLENSMTEEPRGLQSTGSQRVGQDSVTNTHTKAFMGRLLCAREFSALWVNAK